MGIQGLLPLLKSIMAPIHVKEMEGCSVAVDTYSWLHKGALSCSRELCNGVPTTRHIEYCMHRVNLLRHYGRKPVLVFTGSGSRASGLRAPLKDVHNTCTNRSTTAPDFSQFAYVAKNRKPMIPARRS